MSLIAKNLSGAALLGECVAVVAGFTLLALVLLTNV